MLGTLLLQWDRIDESIELLGQAIAVNPADADASYNLGESYRQSGRREEAIASFRRAIELRPARCSIPTTTSASHSTRQLRPDEAIAAYHRAIELRPSFAGAYGNLGNALWTNGRDRWSDRRVSPGHRAGYGSCPSSTRTWVLSCF